MPVENESEASLFDLAVVAVRRGADAHEEAVALYRQLADEERLWLLDGDTPFWPGLASMGSGGFNEEPFPQAVVPRVGLPGIQFTDGPRGVVIGPSTTFPVSMARGATFDVALEERVGDVIGREARAVGANLYGGVCINLPRHPAWGRAQETYGDDPHHLGELGAALVRGVQRHVMATAKHYALNSMENARFHVDVSVDPSTLHDVYLPHFKRVADEGVAAIMSSYNSVNGEWTGENETLLSKILRDDWEWDGITITDWIWGFRDAVKSLNAGMDLEEPFRAQRARDLPAALKSGATTWEMVERSGVRVIEAQLRSYSTRSAGPFERAILADEEARLLSRQVARRAMTLLKNDDVDAVPALPIDPGTTRSIALIGRLADTANTGDNGSSDVVHTPSTVSPFEGLAAAYPDAALCLVTDDDIEAAVAAAEQAEVAVVVVGYTAADEGEYVGGDTFSDPALAATYPPLPDGMSVDALFSGAVDSPLMMGTGGDRESLRLRPVDEELIRAVSAANPRTVVAIVSAGTVIIDPWDSDVPAVLMMWYAGMEGGHALADILSGAENPSGRLPAAIPASEDHLPHFDRDATAITYDRFHGQRLLDKLGVQAAYPYGYGISYTTFVTRDVVLDELSDVGGRITVTVENTGERDGRHVVQIYGSRTTGEYAGESWLLGFLPVSAPAQGSTTVTVPFSCEPLGLWSEESRTRVRPDIARIELRVAAHAHDPAAIAVTQHDRP